MRRRNPKQIIRHPAVVESIRPNARHIPLGHLHNFRLGQHPPLIHRNWIQRIVIRPRPRRHIQIRLSLMQIMPHRRMPLHHGARNILRQRQILPHPIPVIVVLHILTPIHQGRTRLPRLLSVVIGIDGLLPTINFNHRSQESNHITADLPDERTLLHNQPVSQLNQHLRPARLRRMNPAQSPVKRLGSMNQLPSLSLRQIPGIPQLRERLFVLIQIPDRSLIRNGEHHQIPTFFRLAQLPELSARRRFAESFVVPLDIGSISKLPRSPRYPPKELQRRRNRVRCRHMVHKFRSNARVLQILLNEPPILLIHLLRPRNRRSGSNGGFTFRFSRSLSLPGLAPKPTPHNENQGNQAQHLSVPHASSRAASRRLSI